MENERVGQGRDPFKVGLFRDTREGLSEMPKPSTDAAFPRFVLDKSPIVSYGMKAPYIYEGGREEGPALTARARDYTRGAS